MEKSLKKSNSEFRKLDNLETLLEQNKTDTDLKSEPFIQGLVDKELTADLIDTIKFYNNEYGYNVVEELFITNEFGANVALGSGTSDYRQDDEEWWQIAKNIGLYIGEIKYREEYGNYAIEIGFRIDDEGGHFLGVLRVVITLDDLSHEFINVVDAI